MSCAVTAPEMLVKQPSENRQYTMDFSNLMSATEAISSITSITAELRGGGVSDLTISAGAISGQTITFWIEDGTDGETHRIEIIIVTDAGQTLEGDGLISVRDK
jgi:hypothetical protein